MIKRIQSRPQWQRVIIFTLLLMLVIVIVFFLTLGVAYLGVNSGPRSQSITMQDSVTVREWAILPDDDSYPTALTIDSAGNVYTGSYISGTVWRITPEGVVSELPQTRETFGAIRGLAWHDEALYVLDRNNPLTNASMTLWRWQNGSAPEKLHDSNDRDRAPYDLEIDGAGNLYVSFIFADTASVITRYPVQGEPDLWWTAPENTLITGIAYDAAQERMIAVDTKNSDLYAIEMADPTVTSLFYKHTADPLPGFGDATVAPDGTLYLASLDLNRVAALSLQNELTYLAGAFRGSSRLVYDATRQRLYVNNFDNRSLLADQVLFVQVDVTPKLPFALDVIEWK